VLALIFGEAEALAGLKLKVKKTNFIPLNLAGSEDASGELKSWLYTFVPQWADVQIVSSARYLGAFLGPKAASLMWKAPIAKWSNRCLALAQAGAPPGITIELYNTRALTTLSYVSQFSEFPERALPRERAMLGRILHLPGNAIAGSDFFALRH
jgi:hypothetical protein